LATLSIETLKTKPGDLPGEVVYKAGLSDGSLLYCYSAYFPKDKLELLAVGQELTTEDAGLIRFSSQCGRAEKAALALCARAEQSVSGVRLKLRKKEHAAAAVAAVTERLCEAGILDDSRYAAAWLQGRIRTGSKGPRALEAMLRQRGIDRDTAAGAVAAALDAAGERSVLEARLAFFARRPPKLPGAAGGRAKDAGGALRRLLRYEGFSSGLLEEAEEEGLFD
jgi:regulatory protein